MANEMIPKLEGLIFLLRISESFWSVAVAYYSPKFLLPSDLEWPLADDCVIASSPYTYKYHWTWEPYLWRTTLPNVTSNDDKVLHGDNTPLPNRSFCRRVFADVKKDHKRSFLLFLFCPLHSFHFHYNDVMLSAMTSQITSLTIVYSTVYSGADKRKYQGFESLAFVWGFTGDRWIPLAIKGQ